LGLRFGAACGAACGPPAGTGWIHEIKHDGFRILARRDKERVQLFTRNGYDFTTRFPKIAAAVESLSVRSCIVDSEAIVVDKRGLSVLTRSVLATEFSGAQGSPLGV
jgi:bifunctional non-homologous end joining protein LigD